MKSEDFSCLVVSKYEIKLKPMKVSRLPIYLGSTLRGALGYSLKKTVCIVSHGDCERCIVKDKCVYPHLFESSIVDCDKEKSRQIPHPFILSTEFVEGSRPGEYQEFSLDDELNFEMVLIGKTIDYLPYIIYSISQMAERGFGLTQHASFKLTSVSYLNGSTKYNIYDSKKEKLISISSTTTLKDLIESRQDELGISNIQKVSLKFITPTRIRVDNDLKDRFEFSLIVRNLLRRVSMLCNFYGKEKWQQDFSMLVEIAKGVEIKFSQLSWWDFERYSSRQRTRMKLGGVIGKVEYAGGAIAEFLPLLIAGEFLHIGNNTGFGLGKYKIVG